MLDALLDPDRAFGCLALRAAKGQISDWINSFYAMTIKTLKKRKLMKTQYERHGQYAWHRPHFFIGISTLMVLMLLLAACGSDGTSAGSGNATSTVTANPGSDKDPCKDPSYWNNIVGLHNGQKVESVSCGKVL